MKKFLSMVSLVGVASSICSATVNAQEVTQGNSVVPANNNGENANGTVDNKNVSTKLENADTDVAGTVDNKNVSTIPGSTVPVGNSNKVENINNESLVGDSGKINEQNNKDQVSKKSQCGSVRVEVSDSFFNDLKSKLADFWAKHSTSIVILTSLTGVALSALYLFRDKVVSAWRYFLYGEEGAPSSEE